MSLHHLHGHSVEDTCDLIIKTVPDLPHNRIVLKSNAIRVRFMSFIIPLERGVESGV